MAKQKPQTEVAEKQPKKGFLGKLFNAKSEQHKIIKHMKANNIKNFLFYTDVANLFLILEQGIRLVKDQKLAPGEEYTVWTYLENKNSIGLEYDSSTRAHFWKWAANAKIDVTKVAVFGINPERLAAATKMDWAFDQASNIVYIYETIPVNAIEWIMIKDKKNLQRAKTIIEGNELDIKVFFGEKGNIEE